MNLSYPQSVFEFTKPAQIRQGGQWRSDDTFLEYLQDSWQRQYADYIGHKEAERYVQQLRREERLFSHHDPLTIHAWAEDRIVAISALRPLAGIHLITMLEVHPDYQGIGIGTQLVRAHCSVSKNIMAHVSIHQPRATAFYLKSGFHRLHRSTEMHDQHELEFDVLARRNTDNTASLAYS